MPNKYEKPAPPRPRSGEEKFRAREADAKAGLPERAAEAQKAAALNARAGREGGKKRENSEKLEKIAEEIENFPGGPLEETEE